MAIGEIVCQITDAVLFPFGTKKAWIASEIWPPFHSALKAPLTVNFVSKKSQERTVEMQGAR
jgi:hypothetical protein